MKISSPHREAWQKAEITKPRGRSAMRKRVA